MLGVIRKSDLGGTPCSTPDFLSARATSEAPTTTSQSQDEWKPIRLCGTLPAEVVPAERYVRQLWQALDMTHEKAQCGLKSDTPVGQGGTLDTHTFNNRCHCIHEREDKTTTRCSRTP